jgi:hypothetical protein
MKDDPQIEFDEENVTVPIKTSNEYTSFDNT